MVRHGRIRHAGGLRRVLTGALAAVILAGCNLSQGTPTPLPTPDAPLVEFRFPPNNSTVVDGTDLTIELLATDAGAGVARVQLFVDDLPHLDGQPQIAVSVPTFAVTMNWLAQGIGQHSLTAIAYRLDGLPGPPATIIVEVVPREDG